MTPMQKNDLIWYDSPVFSSEVAHGFSTKCGGVSQGDFQSLNLISARGDQAQAVAENYRRFAMAIGFSGKEYGRNSQVHGDIIRLVNTGDTLEQFTDPERSFPAGDGLLTQSTDLALWAYSADCVVILYHDPVTKSIGACHAGWRGTALGISAKMVSAMTTHFGSKPEDLQVAVGPSIKSCCFSCHDDVPKAMMEGLGDKIKPFLLDDCMEEEVQKWSVDLQGIHRFLLEEAGVKHIDCEQPCTACHPDHFWSHRKEGDKRGSMGGMIALKGEFA